MSTASDPPAKKLKALAEAKQVWLATASLDDARRLLPAIIADARSVGTTLDV